MDFYDVVKTRFSVRAYEDRPVEREKLDRILEAARLAPSAKNLQECCYVVVTDREKREQLISAAAGQRFVGQAPVVIVCCSTGDKDSLMRCGHSRYTIDSGIAIEHLALAAAAEGLGSCWIGSFYPDQVREILNIPEDIEVVELLPIGYPSPEAQSVRGRKDIEEIVCYDTWSL